MTGDAGKNVPCIIMMIMTDPTSKVCWTHKCKNKHLFSVPQSVKMFSVCGRNRKDITPVLNYAMELCHSTEMGGRMVISEKDLSRGKIVDCSCWPDDYSQAVLAKFPDCCIVFLSSQVSSLCMCVCMMMW